MLSSSGQLAGATSNRVVSTYEDALQPGRYGIPLRASKPAVVTGGTAVRQVRRVTLSPEMRLLAKSLESFGGLRMQWLRDGKPIRGATRAAYRLRAADAGRKVAPRLSYAPDAVSQWEQAELRKGAVRIVLPRLAPGSYQVRTTYLGSPSLTRSTGRVGLRVVR